MLHQSETESLPAPTYDPVIERLLRARTIIISGEITQRLAATVSSQLLALAAESDADITIFLNSQGGHVEAGDTIHDLIRFIRPKTRMIGTGWVASAGTHVFLAPPKERRVCLPNTRFMIHQPAGGAGGAASDIAIQAKEIIKTRERIARVIAKQTGQDLQKVLTDMERDYWMNPQEAIDYGIVSRIIEKQQELS